MSLLQTAVLAAGCFWGVEAYFMQVPGVESVTVGYTGGTTEDPTYSEICRGDTGHAEAVMVEFDSDVISYEDILRHFFRLHDPTELNRQGNDIGTQYRSAVFVLDEQQRETANSVLSNQNQKVYDGGIVTTIDDFDVFYEAEDYHQDYLEKNPRGYCHVNVSLAREPLD